MTQAQAEHEAREASRNGKKFHVIYSPTKIGLSGTGYDFVSNANLARFDKVTTTFHNGQRIGTFLSG